MSTSNRATSAVYLRRADRVLLLDAGTGIAHLMRNPPLLAGVERIQILLTHFHLDHIIGLSYLPALATDVRIEVLGPGEELYGRPTADLLAMLLGTPYLSATMAEFVDSVGDFALGPIDLDGWDVVARPQLLHSDPSTAFRVEDYLAYCTDTAFDAGNIDFASGCRVLVHEAWRVTNDGDRPEHSTPAEAARVAAAADVGSLVLSHLHPFEFDGERVLSAAAAVFAEVRLGSDLEPLT